MPSDASRRSLGLWLRDAAVPDLLSATAARTSFESLPEEMLIKIQDVLEIIQIAALSPVDEEREGPYDHHFIQDVLFKVSTRLRRIATDSSLWKDQVQVKTKPDFRKLDFIIEECLNSETTSMVLQIEAPPPLGPVTLPNRYLIEMANKFPNIFMVMIKDGRFEEDIPAPWLIVLEDAPKIIVRNDLD